MKKKYRQKFVFSILSIALLASVAFVPMLYGPGIKKAEPMGAYLNGIFPSATPTGSAAVDVGYDVENAFPKLTFIDPVDMVELPDGNEFLVLGLQGHIWKISNDRNVGTKTQLLDISDNVVSDADGGMLGIVLHPDYGKSGSPNSEFIYVFYRYTPVQGTDQIGSTVNGYMRLSRFNLPVGANAINPSSEEVLINVYDRHDWHNGGDMFFGPEDGFLYLAVGDEGASFDSYNVTQQIDKFLFGGVLRIDVDKRGGAISHPIRKQPLNAGIPPTGWPDSFTQGYYIPNSNPWLNTNGSILEEFFAIGTRSPHRMTLDSQTGEIWLGDIGQNLREEINLVGKGDNLQWPYREGNQNGRSARPSTLIGNDKAPIFSYKRTVGRAVIGGSVYRGNLYPELRGKYIYGDHETQEVYTLTRTGDNSGTSKFLLDVPVSGEGSKDGISSFFVDSKGIMYILDLFGTAQDGGVIQKVVRSGAVVDPPKKLSDLNVFTDLQAMTPIDGLVPYDVNAPLWSDGAKKSRWIALPNDGTHDSATEQINFENEENWTFPAGTVVIKQFDLPTDAKDPSKITKLETRFLIFAENNEAYAVTYKWNDEQTDAFLIGIDESVSQTYSVVKTDGSTVNQTWDFPTRAQCVQCHNSVAGYSLGLKTRQLNKRFTYPSTGITGNQLETWSHLNMFSEEIDSYSKLPASANIDSDLASDEMKVRSYVDANCAFCHRPDGVDGAFDGRAMTALYDQALLNEDVASRASPTGFKVVEPGESGKSMLFLRDDSTADDKMPPVGRNLVDDDYLQELIGWIDGLDIKEPKTIIEGWYTLEMGNKNTYLAIENSSEATDARAINVSTNQTENAQWYFEKMGGNKYKIIAKHSDKVLSLQNLKAERGANVVQEDWNGAQHQLWYFMDIGDENFQIVSAYNGLAVHISSGSSEIERPAVLWTKSTSINQQWQISPVSDSPLQTIGERGIVNANHNWTTVNLKKTYKNPVVIAGGAGYKGDNQSTVRVQDVSGKSFKVRIDEWECLDEFHFVEEIPYIVMEAGTYELPNGKKLQAGNLDGITQIWYTHKFDSVFGEEPVVFGQCTTENEAEAVNVFFDEKNTSASQLRLKLKEQDRSVGGHTAEKVSWIAVEPGAFSDGTDKFEFGSTGRKVNQNWFAINFAQNYDTTPIFLGELGSEYGGDAATIRFKELSKGAVKVFLEEEACGDPELRHVKEEVHYMAFNGAGAVQGKVLNQNRSAITLLAKSKDAGFYFENLSTKTESHSIDIDWTTSNDVDVQTYIVERSIDGQNFTLITDQPAKGATAISSYNGYDSNPVIGTVVYRIVAVRKSGDKVYSHNVEVDFKASGTNVLVYPNPVQRTQTLTADILTGNKGQEELAITIYSVDGRLIRTRSKVVQGPQAFEQFEIKDLDDGVYILKVKGSDWNHSRKFIVR